MGKLIATSMACCLLVFCLCCRADCPPAEQLSSDVNVEDKLDAALLNIVNAYENGGAKSVDAYLDKSKLRLEKGKAPVEIIALSEEALEAIHSRLVEAGGEPLARLGNRQYALIPVAAIRELASQQAIWSLSFMAGTFHPIENSPGVVRPTVQPGNQPDETTRSE